MKTNGKKLFKKQRETSHGHDRRKSPKSEKVSFITTVTVVVV